ncbi:autorepressor SdpR family transcription factor [Hirschia maritima]|uniref:autorepressor SdpR family transcription factor n=1 Tax=Hirschia maritima TaxID=1121961 RepID=UPI0004755521|nr:autorepressor SdpR family transcription factor [Hirschia maritima]
MNNIFKALSDPTRQKVLELLKSKPMSAGDIGEHFTFSQPTMSAHLSVLKQADLVQTEKIGKQVFYRLKLTVLEDAVLSLSKTFGIKPSNQEDPSPETFPKEADQ